MGSGHSGQLGFFQLECVGEVAAELDDFFLDPLEDVLQMKTASGRT